MVGKLHLPHEIHAGSKHFVGAHRTVADPTRFLGSVLDSSSPTDTLLTRVASAAALGSVVKINDDARHSAG